MITAYHENCVEKLNLVVVSFAAGFSACAFQRNDFFQPIESVGGGWRPFCKSYVTISAGFS